MGRSKGLEVRDEPSPGWTDWDPRHPHNQTGVAFSGESNPSGCWISVGRAALYFHVNRHRVWEWIKDNRLRAVKMGASYIIPLQAALDFRRLPGSTGYIPTPGEMRERDTRELGLGENGTTNWGTGTPSLLPLGYILTADAARRLNIGIRRVSRLIHGKRLEAVRHSWGWAVSEKSVAAFTRLKRGPEKKMRVLSNEFEE
jgi:excisionase family DNA binding protein